VIDEQHRFGVKQRLAMIEKHKTSKNEHRKNRPKNDLREFAPEYEDLKHLPIPHLLSMSATPIPRTLALTIYGDLDLSILDELPPGRKRAETMIVKSTSRSAMYKKMEEKLKAGKQVYIIAPRIKDSDDEGEKGEGIKKSSVEFEEKRIKEEFKTYKIGTLHGKQSKTDKEKVIEKFYKKEIDILISTTVVEVGVSVPNATCIVIENADTFGLAQLHQLRGRVERSTDHSICFLVTESENDKSLKRLEALVKSNNGFELAEVDLSERGAGSLIGNRQSGLTDIGMEAIKNRKLVEVAKEEAKNILLEDATLAKSEHLTLKQKIAEFTFHEE
jgi:ATP-dependent DNA helicase RecG